VVYYGSGTTTQKSCLKPEEVAVESGPTASHCVAEPWAWRPGISGTVQVRFLLALHI
jgi:hypothetical protein